MRRFLDIKSLFVVVKEFFKALLESRTYNIRKNWYCVFGILWGIPVPVVTIGIDLYSAGLPLTLNNIIERILYHPIHIFFILHPLFFGIVFGAMGTIRHNKDQKIKEFETSLIRKKEELEEANRKLQELDRLKDNFLSMVSHELRTPLTTIQGYVSFLRTERGGRLNEEQKESLRISEEETDHLNHLIEELLDLSKIERGEFKVALQAVQLKEIVTKALISLKQFADQQGIILEDKLPEELPLVLADKEKILQVVSNLIENGIKFNCCQGRVSITSLEDFKDNKIIISICDTGMGIPQDKKDKIFEKFSRVRPLEKPKHGGCGLGLAIAKSIIELHQGRIWVESKLGEGSKFFFGLNKYEPERPSNSYSKISFAP